MILDAYFFMVLAAVRLKCKFWLRTFETRAMLSQCQLWLVMTGIEAHLIAADFRIGWEAPGGHIMLYGKGVGRLQ